MIADQHTPPPLPSHGTYWERSSDPFHIDAMPAEVRNVPPENVIVVGSDRKGFNTGARQEGWMLIDWCENSIGFVADGESFEGEPQAYVLKPGPFGHVCAYPDTPYGRERMKDHEGKDWRRGDQPSPPHTGE